MENKEYCCILCRKSFSSDLELKEHNDKDHSSKNESKFHCSICNKDFRDSFNLKRHMSYIHSPKNNNRNLKCTKCLICSDCFQKKDILDHFSTAHQITVEEEHLEFKSMECFENWKIKMENSTKSRYVKTRNFYKYKDGSTVNNYYCHRDGFVKNSRSKNIRRMKTSGSNKINGHCPSKLVVKCDANDHVSVRFVKTHVGHVSELNRISLNKKEKAEIAEKLSLNIPFDQILDDVRDSLKDSDLQRVHLLSKQDLRNIARDFKVNQKISNDQESNFEFGLEKICNEQSNFLRLYKPKGIVSNEFPQLKTKDFLLLVMSDMQKELLDKYSNNCVCIDVTHGLLLHDIDMYTLFVLDDTQKAFPCAFWFSNRSDVVAMELFFFSIQNVVRRILKPVLVMTNETLHDAWSAVMSPPLTFMYCTWHVDLDWRNNLRKIPNKEKQTIIYKHLRKLMEEEDIKTFNINLERIYFELYEDDETKEFAQYFEKYKNSSDKWANCYRLACGNAFEDIEKMHKSLKYIYLKKKKTCGIDDTVISLMAFLRPKFLDHSIISMIDALMEIKQRHKVAINMTQANLTKINETSWDVSDSNNEETFRVERVKFTCENCQIKCKPCAACIHLYLCSCCDSSVKWNMCEHIHLVCIVANHEQSTSLMTFEHIQDSLKISDGEQSSGCDSVSMPFTGSDSDSESLAIIQHISTPTSEVEVKKKEILNKFTYILDSATNLEQLDLITKQLTPCEQVFGIL